MRALINVQIDHEMTHAAWDDLYSRVERAVNEFMDDHPNHWVLVSGVGPPGSLIASTPIEPTKHL